MSNPKFYLRSRHGDCGSNVMFHNIGGAGYGTNLKNAEIIDLKRAQEELNWTRESLPLLKEEVDKLAIQAVDHQYLNEDKNVDDPNDEYVIQIKGTWNGNDIGFLGCSGITYDYGKAQIIPKDKCDQVSKVECAVWSKSYLDSICRSTFQSHNINMYQMVTKAGLKLPRKKKPRSSRVRWNCPVF